MLRISLPIILATTLLLIVGCGNNSTQNNQNNNTDTIRTDSVKAQHASTKINIEKYNRVYNDVARYIAGMLPLQGSALDSSLLKNKDWKAYADAAEKKWQQYDSTRLKILKNWSDEELQTINKKGMNLFYPFSGPDVLNAKCLFYNADTIVMIGLEPVGTVPFLNGNTQDTLSNYFRTVNNSLYAILNFSFFRTVAMKQDLRNQQLNGTTPLMLIFLARTGSRVLDVKPIHVDSIGKIAANENDKNYKMSGVEITYCNADTTLLSRVLYFSCDLSNGGIDGTIKPFYTFINQLPPHTTYLKSASYLMHDNYFSVIRNVIIDKSQNILQDDSGIPHKYFKNYKYTLYGKYTGVITLFKGNNQKDLDSIYKTDHPKALNFGIGYKWHKGESNLALYCK